MLRGTRRIGSKGAELSRDALRRLQWMDWYRGHGENGRLTCRHFNISPDTFYTWLRRYDPKDLRSLEDRSQRPKRVRTPTWSPELVQAVLALRQTYPRWGKDKLAPLLAEEGHEVSVSMVGRIMSDLKRRGLLVEPVGMKVHIRKRALSRPYAIRKPREYVAKRPGDLVEVDTMDLRPLPGVILKQFTARDVVSRWDVLDVRGRATATTATQFLAELRKRLPFPLRAIQVDGGSEFMANFEQSCKEMGIRLFVLPPHSPKLNGHVERANRTHAEEFWECYYGDLNLPTVRAALVAWEHTYNEVRPHQALGYLSPAQYLAHSWALPLPTNKTANSRPDPPQTDQP
jgi:putative transposase